MNFSQGKFLGSGGVKVIGNYAPGMMPSKNAKKEGYAEIIYLDAVEHRFVEEVGAANFFCVKDRVIYTPELTGTILPVITRDSIVQLARDSGYIVNEEKVDVDFAMQADEVFCAGTAAVISPIGRIEQHGDKVTEYCNGEVGKLTGRIVSFVTRHTTTSSRRYNNWIHIVKVHEIICDQISSFFVRT